MERPLVKRTSISNRGDDATFVLDCGLAGGDDGGGGVSLPNARAGEPMILCAGADRGVTVVNETRMRAVARWTNAMKAVLSYTGPSPYDRVGVVHAVP